MIAFAVVLNRKLPIGRHTKVELAVCAAVIDRFVEFRPAGDDIGVCVLKCGGRSVDVDEHDIHPHVAPDFDQAKGGAVNFRMGVLAWAANVRGRDQLTRG